MPKASLISSLNRSLFDQSHKLLASYKRRVASSAVQHDHILDYTVPLALRS
jgi:hypothetical protein